MKKYISIFAALALIILLTGCVAEESPTASTPEIISNGTNSAETTGIEDESSDAELVASQPNTVFMPWSEDEQITLEQAISESNCVVRAKYVSYEEFEEYVDYRFQLIDIYKGSADEELIIRWGKEFTDEFEQMFYNGEYILPLKYFNGVYFDYPFYNVVGHILIPCDTNGGIQCVSVDGFMTAAPSEISTASGMAALTASVEDTSENYFKDYIHSELPEEIAEGSDYIVKAVINGEPSRTGSDRGIYNCDLIQSYKGNVEDSFRVLLFYDSVEEGGEYYLFLSKNEKSVYYTISSKNSIYKSDNVDITSIVFENFDDIS